MRLRTKILFVAASAMATLVGCEEPKEIVPVAPPGFDLVRTPTNPGPDAQALGEQSAAVLAQSNEKPTPSIIANASSTPIGKPETTATGLIYETLVEGNGPIAKSGDSVEMHYTGTLENGTKFDSSFDHPDKKPLPVILGTGRVIRGWDEGVPGMKVGEKRKLIIPPQLAYKDQAQKGIPANSTLIFEVELVKINP